MSQIQATGLTKAFDGQVVLHGIDLSLPQGAFLALLGPSGCGKTTLLRLIAGLEVPDAGTLSFGDRLIASDRHFVPPQDRDLGMVFQSYALWPGLDVRGNIDLALKARRLSRADRAARTDQMLDAVGLTDLAARKPHQLSGGQRQRVALARSLALRPALLLLDEPLANLDAHLRHRMLAEFRRLHGATGTTFILVTHDQDEAMAVATHIAVMQDGRIDAIGTPEDLYRRPATPMVARFIDHGTTLPVTVTHVADGMCHGLLGARPFAAPGTAGPGPAWLCLHRPDLAPANGPGHFRAEVLTRSFQHGRHLTHVLPQDIGVQMVSLSLSLDAPLAPHRMIDIAVTGGWVIPRNVGTTQDSAPARQTADHSHLT